MLGCAREYKGQGHSLGSAFLGGHAYLAQPKEDYGGAQGAVCEKVYTNTTVLTF